MEYSNLQEKLLGDAGGNGSRMEEGVAAAARGNDKQQHLTVDDMLVQHVGEFGPSQLSHFVLVSFAWTLEALHTMTMIFADRVPEWRCAGQGFSSVTNSSSSSSILCSPTTSLCDLEPGTWEWVGGKSASTVSQFNLICGEEYKVGLAGSLFFIGCLLGAGTWGNVSDSVLGRKGSLALCSMTTVTLGLLTSLAPNYWLYALARFVTGLSAAGIGISAFVLSTEIVGPNRRGTVGMCAFYFFSLGIILLPLFDILSSSWKQLYLLTALPGAFYCILVLPFIWESPRWYLVKGRVGEAMNVMHVFAKRNGNVVPGDVSLIAHSQGDEEGAPPPNSSLTKDFRDGGLASPRQAMRKDSLAALFNGAVTSLPEEKENSEFAGTLLDVFRYGETRLRMILMVFIWFFVGVCYYGISLNVVNLGFNLHISVFLNGLVELPAYVLTALMLSKMGRRSMLVAALLSSGVCCLGGSFVFSDVPDSTSANGSNQDFKTFFSAGGKPNYSGVIRLLCGIIGIFGCAGAYNLIYIYTTELFPTVVRNAALGLATQAGSFGSIIAPVVAVFGRTNASLPFIVFGSMSLAAAALGSRLPETRNESLHETMEGMERVESLKNGTGARNPNGSTPVVD